MSLDDLNMTPEEKAVMDDIMVMYERAQKSHAETHGVTDIVLTHLLNSERNPGKTLYEMSLEVIARRCSNFRSNNTFRNRLLAWQSALRPGPAIENAMMIAQSSLMQEWLTGVVMYYLCYIVEKLTTLEVDFSDDSHTRGQAESTLLTAMGPSLDQLGASLGSDRDIEAVIDRAQRYTTKELCESPIFAKILRLMPDFMRGVRVADALAHSFTDDSATHNHSGVATAWAVGGGDSSHSKLEKYAKKRDCLLAIFIVMLGALQLHYLHTVSTTANSGSTSRTNELRLQLAATMSIFRQSSEDRDLASDIIGATTLRYARTACTLTFPPRDIVERVNELNRRWGPGSPAQDVAPALTAEEYRSQPLFRAVTRDIPRMIKNVVSFMAGTDVNRAWVTTVMVTQLYRFNPASPKASGRSGTAEAAAVATGVRAGGPQEYECSSAVKPRDSLLFQLLLGYLRPLLRQLLRCEPPGPEGGEDGAAVSGAGVEAEGGAATTAAALTRNQREALEALEELVSAVDDIVLPSCTKMRRWALLGIGEHHASGSPFGQDCLREALSDVLVELMCDMLVWTTQPRSEWVTVRRVTDRQRLVTDDNMLPFYSYLIRAEELYHELTSLSPSTRGVAGSSARVKDDHSAPGGVAVAGADAGRTIAITALHRHKAQFYHAVSDALQTIYPANANFALIIPTVNAVHAYLLRAVEAVLAEGGAAPTPVEPKAPAGARAVKKGPPPRGAVGLRKGPPGGSGGGGAAVVGTARPPSLVPTLASKADFHSALRLVDSIKSRDLFFAKYLEMLQLRLLFRPPRQRIRDEDFDAAKRDIERGACEYIATVTTEAPELRAMRKMIDDFKPSYFTSQNEDLSSAVGGGGGGGGAALPKLVVNALGWRSWYKESGVPYLPKDADAPDATPHLVNVATAGTPTQSEPLPFPNDLWASMAEFQATYEGSHRGIALSWLAPEVSQVTFTLAYPKDEGRLTTIHGTVLLEQLLLAISQYRREGVSWETLARRAKKPIEDLRKLLARAERDGLLVIVNKDEVSAGSPEERISLNYEFTRPPQSRTGEFSYWPRCKQKTDSIDAVEQRNIMDVRVMAAKSATIQVMKGSRQLAHQPLFAAVRKKVASHFELTLYVFKRVIDELVENEFIKRDSENGDVYHYQS